MHFLDKLRERGVEITKDSFYLKDPKEHVKKNRAEFFSSMEKYSPVSQLAEELDLKSSSYQFESDWGYL